MHPYRTLELPLVKPLEAPPKKTLRCLFGFHKPSYITVTRSTRFICIGLRVRFHCGCGKVLKEEERPTKRPVTITFEDQSDPNWTGFEDSRDAI